MAAHRSTDRDTSLGLAPAPGNPRLRISGDIDLATAPGLAARLASAVALDPRLELDLSRVALTPPTPLVTRGPR